MIRKFAAADKCPVALVAKPYRFQMTTSVDPTSLMRGGDLRAAVAAQIMADRRLDRLTGELVDEVVGLRSVRVAADTLMASAEVDAVVVTPRQGEEIAVGPGCVWRAQGASQLQLVGRAHGGRVDLVVTLEPPLTLAAVSTPMAVVRVEVTAVHRLDALFRVEGRAVGVTTLTD